MVIWILALPAVGWSFAAPPTVTIASLKQVNGTYHDARFNGTWSSASNTLRVELRAQVAAGFLFNVNVSGVSTPASVQNAGEAQLKTLHSDNELIDGPSTIATDLVTAGTLRGAVRWGSNNEHVYGAPEHVALSFATAGRVATGGKLRVVFPLGAAFDSAPPAATFLSPANMAGIIAWDSNTRTLDITTSGVVVQAGEEIIVHIHNQGVQSAMIIFWRTARVSKRKSECSHPSPGFLSKAECLSLTSISRVSEVPW